VRQRCPMTVAPVPRTVTGLTSGPGGGSSIPRPRRAGRAGTGARDRMDTRSRAKAAVLPGLPGGREMAPCASGHLPGSARRGPGGRGR
jgi:hypothetical protein